MGGAAERKRFLTAERRRFLTTAVVVAVLLGVVVLIGRLTAHGSAASQPPPTTEPVWMTEHVSQDYWYCWDTGPLQPHHLGHRVLTDHLCTDQELASLGHPVTP
jgi:hypothetical protein